MDVLKKLEGFARVDALPSRHAPMFSHTNSCNFASFKSALKSWSFDLKF